MNDNIRFFPDNNATQDCGATAHAQSLSLKRLTLYVLIVPTVIVSTIIAAVGAFATPDARSAAQPIHTTYLLTASSGKQLCLANVTAVALQSDMLVFELATGKAFFPASKFFAVPLGPMPLEEGLAMCDVIMRATEKANVPKTDGPA